MSLKHELSAIPENALVDAQARVREKLGAPDFGKVRDKIYASSPALGQYIDQYIISHSPTGTLEVGPDYQEEIFRRAVALGALCLALIEHADLTEIHETLGAVDLD